MELITQGLGALGIIASIISFQCKKHKWILFFRTLNEFLFGVQYLLLGAYTGMMMNFVSCIRNIIFSQNVAKNRKNTVAMLLFSGIFVLFGVLTWAGPKSIFVMVAKILSSLAYGNKNTTIVRTIILLTSSSWLIYNYFVGSYAGVLCEIFTLGSLILGIIRLDLIPFFRKKKEKTEE